MQFHTSAAAQQFLGIDCLLWPEASALEAHQQQHLSEIEMAAKIACSPPLGQVSVLDCTSDEIEFHLATGAEYAVTGEDGYQFELWHNAEGNDCWKAVSFLPSPGNNDAPLNLKGAGEHACTTYTCRLHVSSERGSITYTLRYRKGSSTAWTWTKEAHEVPDGTVILRQGRSPLNTDLTSYFSGTDKSISIKPVPSEHEDVVLWSLTFGAGPVTGTESCITSASLGVPGDYLRWMALVRHWSPWLAPRHGLSPFSPDKTTVVASFLRKDGLHVVCLAIGGVQNANTTLSPGGKGAVVANCRNDEMMENTGRVLVCVGYDFDECMSALVKEAQKIVMSMVAKPDIARQTTSREKKTSINNVTKTETGDVKSSWYQGWYDGLSYCTWNGLGRELSETKLLNALSSLEAAGIRISNLIIDDNWQSLDDKKRWMRFEANEKNFPQGLKHCVQKIKEQHKGIEQIAVWHALLGYWGGIHPEGEIAKTYKSKEVTISGGRKLLVVAQDDVQKMYDAFYEWLEGCGINSVKTDAQFYIDEFNRADDRRSLINAYQDAWRNSYLTSFSGQVISCMSQAVPIIFHSQLPTNNPAIVVRNSDDFFPNEPSSHAWHIHANAHNALLNTHLTLLPDWDMFQTHHAYGAYHAAARCISGGPVYITDEPGKHDLDVIAQMTARSVTGGYKGKVGKTVVLRAGECGRAVQQYRGFDEGGLLYIGARHHQYASLLGVWNVGKGSVLDLVPLTRFPTLKGLSNEQEFIVRSHRSGRICAPQTTSRTQPGIPISIAEREWDILTAYPVTPITSATTTTRASVLGLIGKLSGAAAILSAKISLTGVQPHRVHFEVVLKALGRLGIWIEGLREGRKEVGRDFMVVLGSRVVPVGCVSIERGEGFLVVDLERAWGEMGLEGGLDNEVRVGVWMG